MNGPIAIYPGTFDPITYGHIDVVKRATAMFPRIIVLIARNPVKDPLFTIEQRLEMVRVVFRVRKEIITDSFDGLLVDYARKHRATVLIRGLRAVSDFEYEFQMALTNRKLARSVDTVFLVPDERYTYLNSSIVREIARLGGEVTDFVPPTVHRLLMKRMKGKA